MRAPSRLSLREFRILGYEVGILARGSKAQDECVQLHWTRDLHPVPVERCIHVFIVEYVQTFQVR